MAMSDRSILYVVLFTSGIIPFTLLGGWGPAGDHSVVPWAVGFGCQAGIVLGLIAQRRGWWRQSNRNLKETGHG